MIENGIIMTLKESTGRLATEVANILSEKKQTIYTPHVDTGDYVLIIMQKNQN